MPKITLYKQYSDGSIRSITANDTTNNVMVLLSHGYFLSEAEAKSGKVAEEKPIEEKPKRRGRPPGSKNKPKEAEDAKEKEVKEQG